jgi:hypothetical protein
MNKLTIEIPLSLINETPNNYELGEKVRKLVNKLVEPKKTYGKQLSIFPDEIEYTDEYFKPNYIDPYHPLKNN